MRAESSGMELASFKKEVGELALSPLCTIENPREDGRLKTGKRVLARHGICQHLDHGLLSFQNSAEYISGV